MHAQNSKTTKASHPTTLQCSLNPVHAKLHDNKQNLQAPCYLPLHGLQLQLVHLLGRHAHHTQPAIAYTYRQLCLALWLPTEAPMRDMPGGVP